MNTAVDHFPRPDRGRVPPINLEAEQSLLGALMTSGAVYDRVSDILKPEHFANELHGIIYRECSKIILRGGTADWITLKPLFSMPGIPGVDSLPGGSAAAYLARLKASATTLFNARDYAKAIFDSWRRRAVIEACARAMDHAYDASVEGDYLSALASDLDMINEGAEAGGLEQIGKAAGEAYEIALAAKESGNQITGLSTGFTDLDRLTGGLNPGELIILAARPGMGKTALGCGIALNVALSGKPVSFFSLEMPKKQIARRMMCSLSGVPLAAVRRGTMSPSDCIALDEARRKLATLPIYITEASGLSPATIRARARGLRRRYGPGITIADHIQIMSGGEARYGNRTAEITDISKGLKAAAKELDGPVLALSQLSRAVEGRDEKRPTLADLRESGSIEQDADAVLFIYREEYYHRAKEPDRNSPASRTKYSDWLADLEEIKGKAEVIAAKQRDGETGRCELYFNGALASFGNLSKGEA